MRHHDPKPEPSEAVLERLRTEVWQLPYLDRCSILIGSIIQLREAYVVSDAMVKMTVRLSSGIGATDRLRISEAMRSAADVLDHPEYVGLKD
jgi:hypothetical protein